MIKRTLPIFVAPIKFVGLTALSDDINKNRTLNLLDNLMICGYLKIIFEQKNIFFN